MKLSDLIRQVNRDLDDDFPSADIVDWFNRALDDLTPIAKKEARQTYTIDSTNSYALPTDLHEIAFVMVDGKEYHFVPQRDRTTTGYKVWAGQLSLQNGPTSGQIELYYYRKLNYLSTSDVTAEPEIPSQFHDLLIHYAVGNIQFMEEDYDGRPDALTKYYQRKEEFLAYMNQTGEVYQIREVW